MPARRHTSSSSPRGGSSSCKSPSWTGISTFFDMESGCLCRSVVYIDKLNRSAWIYCMDIQSSGSALTPFPPLVCRFRPVSRSLVHMGRGGEDSDNGMATHIIIDEVHERSLDSDLLCLVLKLMHANMPNLRLLLMSATLQVRGARLGERSGGASRSPEGPPDMDLV